MRRHLFLGILVVTHAAFAEPSRAPPRNPVELRERATGHVTIELGYDGCFGGSATKLDLSWRTDGADGSVLEPKQKRHATFHLTATEMRELLANVVDIWRWAPPAGVDACTSTTHTFAKIVWLEPNQAPQTVLDSKTHACHPQIAGRMAGGPIPMFTFAERIESLAAAAWKKPRK